MLSEFYPDCKEKISLAGSQNFLLPRGLSFETKLWYRREAKIVKMLPNDIVNWFPSNLVTNDSV